MKKHFLIILFLLSINSISSQNDSIKSLVKKSVELNLDMWDLTTFAEEHIKDEEQLARFFYYWIGNNIKYDHELLQKINNISNTEFWESQDEYIVYEDRKGVCAGYAKLFEWFMQEIGIEVVVVSGHIRDEENHYVELTLDDDYRHAWNVIKLNENWMLIDTTWGTSNDESQSEFYFDLKPEFSIISHYPEESKWQLLETPLTLEEFNNSKFINTIWFYKGFTDIPKLKEDNEYYYFVFRTNTKNWSINLKYSADNLNFKSIKDIIGIEQDGYTYAKFSKAQMPKRIYFKVKITNNQTSYDNVINFKIN